MAIWKVNKFRELDELNMFLNGAVVGGDVSYFAQTIAQGGGGQRDIPPLVGLTFKTKAPGPAGTCTFIAGANPGGKLLFKEIKSQIEGAIAGVKVRQFEGHLVIVESSPANGITIDKTGTANAVLGFDTGNDTIGKVYGTPYGTPTPPYFGFAYSVNDNMHVVYTFE